MLPTPAQVRQYIADGLPCDHLDVQGDGSHFDAVIVSAAFEGKRLIHATNWSMPPWATA